MAESYFPFDSKFIGLSESGLPKGDRDGSAADFAKYDADRFTNGVNVFENPNALLVVAGTGMTVNIQAGVAYIQGRRYEVDAAGKTLTLPVGNSQPRIDRIVVTMDDHEALRSCVGTVKAGTPAASPAAPALTRTIDALGETFQISLMRILVPANATSISQCTLIDERADTTVCGWSLSRRTPQPPMPGDAVLHSEIGVVGGPAAYAHNHTAGQLPALSSAVDQTGTTVGANQAAVKAAYDRGTAGVNAAATADAKAQAVINQLNAVGTAGGPAFTATKAEWAAGIPQYTPLVFLFNNNVENATLKINAFPAYAIVNTYGGNAKFKAGFHTLIFNGANFFECSGGGGLALPSPITAGDTPFYVANDFIYAAAGAYAVQRTLTMKTAGIYRFTHNLWGSGQLVRAKIQKNGIDVAGSEVTTYNLGAYASPPLISAIDIVVAANDVITYWMRADYGGQNVYHNLFKISQLWPDLATEYAKLI